MKKELNALGLQYLVMNNNIGDLLKQLPNLTRENLERIKLTVAILSLIHI